jgi:hypothetical protein
MSYLFVFRPRAFQVRSFRPCLSLEVFRMLAWWIVCGPAAGYMCVRRYRDAGKPKD